MDQGAFNQFYENEIKGKPINKVRVPCVLRAALQHCRPVRARRLPGWRRRAGWRGAGRQPPPSVPGLAICPALQLALFISLCILAGWLAGWLAGSVG